MPYVIDHLRINDLQLALIEETYKLFPEQSTMIGGKDVACLLGNLISLSHAKQGFEIGVFTGYSTLAMALALPDDGKIIAFDVSKEFTDVGRKYWAQAQVSQKIDLRLMNAIAGLDELIEDEKNHGTFDFAFIDADKLNYMNYYERVLVLLKKGGWIVIDNSFAGNGVIDPVKFPRFGKESISHIGQLNDKLKIDPRVTQVLLNIADGVQLVVKK